MAKGGGTTRSVNSGNAASTITSERWKGEKQYASLVTSDFNLPKLTVEGHLDDARRDMERSLSEEDKSRVGVFLSVEDIAKNRDYDAYLRYRYWSAVEKVQNAYRQVESIPTAQAFLDRINNENDELGEAYKYVLQNKKRLRR